MAYKGKKYTPQEQFEYYDYYFNHVDHVTEKDGVYTQIDYFDKTNKEIFQIYKKKYGMSVFNDVKHIGCDSYPNCDEAPWGCDYA